MVSDCPELRDLLSLVLEDAGYQPVGACDLKAASQVLVCEQAVLVVGDFCEPIRRTPGDWPMLEALIALARPNARFIALSVCPVVRLDQGLWPGVIFLGLPFELDELLAAAAAVCPTTAD